MLSFVVPAHNEEVLLGRALAAIHHAAKKVGQPYEVIVVDDASTDGTAEVARRNGATVVAVNHRQIAATRNAGARAARGERLFFIDADTFINSPVLGEALRALDRGAAGGGAPPKLDGPVPLYMRQLVLFLSVVGRIGGLSGGAFLFCRRDAFEAVGGFSEQLYGAEDAAMSAALKREGRFVILWRRVLTSGRRARSASGLRMLGFVLQVAVRPSTMLMDRANVAKLWYDSDRDRDVRVESPWLYHASNMAALVTMLVIISGPMWVLPLPPSLSDGPLGTVKYGVQVFLCHLGLIVWPCAYLLARQLMRQRRWVERVKLAGLLALCLWIGVSSAREVFWFWRGIVAPW